MPSFSLQVNVVGAGGSETARAHNRGIAGLLLRQPLAAFQLGLDKDDGADACMRLSSDSCHDFGMTLHCLYLFDAAM